MKSIFFPPWLCFCLALFLFLTGCASPGVGPKGLIYSKTKIGVYSNGENSNLTGRTCIHSFLGLIAFGNGSIEAGKKNGKINKVTSVNWEASNYLSIYASLCVIVGGNN